MFRHVVMFRWAEDAPPEARAGAVEALRVFGREIADLGTLVVGADAGLAAGNFDAVVVVDFAAREDYLRYVDDPRHQRLLSQHLRPILEQRVAVQHEV